MAVTFSKLMDNQGNFYNGNQMSCTLSDASIREVGIVASDQSGKPAYSAMVIPHNPVPTLEELCPTFIGEPTIPTAATGLSKYAAVALAAASVSLINF